LLCGVFWFLRKNSLYTKVVRFSFNQRTEDRGQNSHVGAAFSRDLDCDFYDFYGFYDLTN
ncbi:MAG: hypothetical protein WBG51_16690, partial [Syntrophobacteria bacterium]